MGGFHILAIQSALQSKFEERLQNESIQEKGDAFIFELIVGVLKINLTFSRKAKLTKKAL